MTEVWQLEQWPWGWDGMHSWEMLKLQKVFPHSQPILIFGSWVWGIRNLGIFSGISYFIFFLTLWWILKNVMIDHNNKQWTFFCKREILNISEVFCFKKKTKHHIIINTWLIIITSQYNMTRYLSITCKNDLYLI